MTVVVVAAALAAWLCGARLRRVVPTSSGVPTRTGVATGLVLAAGAVWWASSLSVETMVLAAVGLVLTLVISRLVHRRRLLAASRRRSAQVLLACDSIAGDLGVGLTQRIALDRVASQWTEFAPVAAAAHLDADVAGELRRLAALPGATELASLAAAWQVAHRSGAGLATTLTGVAEVIRGEMATARLVETELAAARATANLMVALPIGVLLLGAGIGAQPWQFLIGSPIGLGCLIIGLALDLAGVWWMQGIAAKVLRS